MQGERLSRRRLFSRTYLDFFVLTLWDYLTQEASHTKRFTLVIAPSYTFCWQWYPFHMPSLELCIPLDCCKCTVFKIRTNHKTRPFTHLFSQACNASVSPFWAFLPYRNGSFPYPFIYFNKWNLNPLVYLKPENGTPFGWTFSVQAILRSSPPPPRDSSRLWIFYQQICPIQTG